MVLDESRILSKVDELDKYLEEIEKIKPTGYKEYESLIEKKRACERLLQISIECVIDICHIISKSLKLGIPADEDDLIEKLRKKKVFSDKAILLIKQMKGFRNILVHKYGTVDDELVFESLEHLNDFDKLRGEILNLIKDNKLA